MYLDEFHDRYAYTDNWGALTPFIAFHAEVIEQVEYNILYYY